MFRLEESKKLKVPELQYLYSVGTEGTMSVKNNSSGVNTTNYFYPSIVFPHAVELISISLLHKQPKDNADKIIISMCMKKDLDTPVVEMNESYNLHHIPGKLVTTLTFPKRFLLTQNQPFYFYCKSGRIVESTLMLAYKNLE